MSIEVPIHTVIKFTPSRGGGWMESRHPLLPEEQSLQAEVRPVSSVTTELSTLTVGVENFCSTPIWGDHVPVGIHAMQRSSKVTQFSE
jgi:hypothetical protein